MQWKQEKAAFIVLDCSWFCCSSHPGPDPPFSGVGTDHCLLWKTELLLNTCHDSCCKETARFQILGTELLFSEQRGFGQQGQILPTRVPWTLLSRCYPESYFVKT